MKNLNFRTMALAVALNLSGIVFAVALVCSLSAMAEDTLSEDMSKQQYEFLENNLRAEYRLTKVQCHSLSLFARYLCILEARSKKDTAIAELEANYKLSAKTQHNVPVARTAPDNDVCEDPNGAFRGMCKSEAKVSLNQ